MKELIISDEYLSVLPLGRVEQMESEPGYSEQEGNLTTCEWINTKCLTLF